MTLAAIDRLVHHATILEMNVESYRRREALDHQGASPLRLPRLLAVEGGELGALLVDLLDQQLPLHRDQRRFASSGGWNAPDGSGLSPSTALRRAMSSRTAARSLRRWLRPGPGVAVAPSRLLAQASTCRHCVTRCLNGATPRIVRTTNVESLDHGLLYRSFPKRAPPKVLYELYVTVIELSQSSVRC
jgi:hypothetical protein